MSRNNILVILFFFILSNHCFSQIERIEFFVKDSSNNNAVPHANIGLYNKPVGSNANEEGKINFLLNVTKVDAHDLFIISSIGYESLSLSLSQLLKLKGKTVFIKPKTYTLNEVIISARKTKLKILGKNEKGALTHSNVYSVNDTIDDGLSKEFGTIIKSKRYCILNSYNVFFSSNNFEKLKLRVNVYTLNDKNMPDSLVNDRDVIYKVTNSYVGWVHVDLRAENIVLKNKKYGITSQIVKTENANEHPVLAIPVTSPSPFNGLLYKDKSQSEWLINTSANPSIYIEASCETN